MVVASIRTILNGQCVFCEHTVVTILRDEAHSFMMTVSGPGSLQKF